MPEKAAFFHFYSAFCFIPREISGLGPRNLERTGTRNGSGLTQVIWQSHWFFLLFLHSLSGKSLSMVLATLESMKCGVLLP